ncbi:hypothetical protein C439_17428 [Haloferax mediterranei ATCC 33500]|nr:hypothetical protein BM92_15825 [Haloferax mediterranei ATCC 33500]ELZ97126.1 hypothetical protein C439_17428 [Haloferax mediterranei ATCC 33500]
MAYQELKLSFRGRYIVPVKRMVQWFAFWAAVFLPFVLLFYLGLGLNTLHEVTVFAGLVMLNSAAVFLGHEHNRS